MPEDKIQGRFVWHELQTTDPQAAEAFYTAVIGWTTKAFDGNPSYKLWIWDGGEAGMGGLMEQDAESRAAGAPPSWLAYVGSEDVEATVERAKKLGGTVLVPPTDIPTVGRFAVVRDPQGAVTAPFKPGRPGSPDEEPGLGDFSWHELYTTDPEAGFAFYSDLYGWEKTSAMDMGEMGIYQMYGQNGRPYGGIFNPGPEAGPPSWLHYIHVPDVHAVAEKIKAHGGQVTQGPMEVPGGDWIVMGIDPQGGRFAVHHTAAAGGDGADKS